jgi:hypothetical protein
MNTKTKDIQFLPEVSVDSGMIWIGDPCYIMADDARFRVSSWDKFCDAIHKIKQFASNGFSMHPELAEPLGEGIGVAIDTGGDGGYTVKPIYNEHTGKVVSITIDFPLNMTEDQYTEVTQ